MWEGDVLIIVTYVLSQASTHFKHRHMSKYFLLWFTSATASKMEKEEMKKHQERRKKMSELIDNVRCMQESKTESKRYVHLIVYTSIRQDTIIHVYVRCDSPPPPYEPRDVPLPSGEIDKAISSTASPGLLKAKKSTTAFTPPRMPAMLVAMGN